MDEFLISIDIDWAPDFAIEQVAQKLIDCNVKCTWFVTHNSPAVKKLAQNKLFELGIHPNFLQGSSHGNNADEIIKYCLDIVPNAKSIRTHTLHQSSGLLKKIREDYEILVDSSIYLPYAKNIEPHFLNFSHNSKPLTRFPYFWEDDAECYRAEKNWDFNNEKLFVKGLKIFNFHPTYIYLNVDTMYHYERLKMEKCSKIPLYDIEEVEMAEYKNMGNGAGELFNNLVDYMAKNQPTSHTLTEIYETFCKE